MKNYQNYSTVIGIIKEFLHNFNLPMIPVYTKETVPFKNRVYIKDNKIAMYNGSTFDVLMAYNYNREVLNLTKNLTINSSDYDTHTHYYLGEYLRFLRDYNKINLMGMYNCFYNDQPSKIYHSTILEKDALGNVTKSYILNTEDTKYNYYIVPVKFNKEYTVAIDSSCAYDITCILYDNKFIDSTSDELIKQSLTRVNSSKFSNPFIYSTRFACAEDNWQKEKILVMLLKLPKRVDSSIVVLEGDFTNCANIIDGNLINKVIYGDDYNLTYSTKCSLLEYNNHISYPFADRLIEYLICNTIDSREYIPENVGRIQTKIFPTGIKGLYDLWDEENIRETLHNLTLKADVTKGKNIRWSNTIQQYDTDGSVLVEAQVPKRFIDSYNDITSYVDKDVESLIDLIESHPSLLEE